MGQREVTLPGPIVRLTLDEAAEQGARLDRAAHGLVGPAQGRVAVREADEHERLAIAQLRSVGALLDQMVERGLGTLEERQGHVHRHAETTG